MMRVRKRELVRDLLILTLLAWATQTLLSQWGYGQELAGEPVMAEEKFVPSANLRPATVELKAEASVTGAEIRLSQIARWSEADAAQMNAAADLVVARFGPGQSLQTIDIESLKTTLEGAGVNLITVSFCGALGCKVSRADAEAANAPVDLVTKIQQMIPTTQPAEKGVASAEPSQPPRSLREVLTADLAERIGVSADVLQVRFTGDDEKLVIVSEPLFQFAVKPSRVRKLGEVFWEVTLTAGGKSQNAQVRGYARMWQNQLVVVRPLTYKQPIRDEDVVEKRVLVDSLSDDPMVVRDQVVGQQAGRELKPNMVLTGRMIEAVQLVRQGQTITVIVESGRVQVRLVAEARESGSYGQTVRVRKPETREEFSVVLTGPQQGKLLGEASDTPKVAVAKG